MELAVILDAFQAQTLRFSTLSGQRTSRWEQRADGFHFVNALVP
jgi:hypothetical protein